MNEQKSNTSTAPAPRPPDAPRQPINQPGSRHILARVITAGTLAAAAVTLLGVVLFLVTGSREPVNYATFDESPGPLATVRGVFRGVLDLDPKAIIQLGVVLLILTPAARVACTLIQFIIERDKLYIAVTLIVLAILIYGLAGGAVH